MKTITRHQHKKVNSPAEAQGIFAKVNLTRQRMLEKSITAREIIFVLALLFCFTPWVTPPVALVVGLIVAQLIGHPFIHLNHKATNILLQVSVVGLGFGTNLQSALATGQEGILFTVISIAATLALGLILGKLLKIDRGISQLISSGTAICGGSAIAAIAPVIRAEERQISVALGTIFMLNSLALFIFPAVGHWLGLTQQQFGLWAAIAIHDTSSVVGAANHYGAEALQIATTVKLTRALWIIPVAIIMATLLKNKQHQVKMPWFIGLFILAMIASTYITVVARIAPYLVQLAKTGLTLTLFLVGAGLSRKAIQAVGWKPLLQGVLLWSTISVGALWAIITIV